MCTFIRSTFLAKDSRVVPTKEHSPLYVRRGTGNGAEDDEEEAEEAEKVEEVEVEAEEEGTNGELLVEEEVEAFVL